MTNPTTPSHSHSSSSNSSTSTPTPFYYTHSPIPIPIPFAGLPPTYAHIASSFPFGYSPSFTIPPNININGTAKPTLQSLIAHFLPPYDEATRLCGLYLQQAPWFFGAVREEQIGGEMLPMWYGVGESAFCGSGNGQSQSQSQGGSQGGIASGSGGGGLGGTSHDLALLFMIFCFGHTTDVNLPAPPENLPADKYYQLAKVALTVDTKECGFGSLISGYHAAAAAASSGSGSPAGLGNGSITGGELEILPPSSFPKTSFLKRSIEY